MGNPTTPVLDDFTGTNAQALSARSGWTVLTGKPECEIQSNQATGTAGDSCFNLRSSIPGGADEECYYTVKTKPLDGEFCYLMTRLTTTDKTTVDGYYLEISVVAGTDTWGIFEWLNGSGTLLGSTASSEVSANDVIFLEAIGSTLTAYKNGTQIVQQTDATYGAAGYIGLGLYGTTVRVDDFGGGVVSTGTTVALSGSAATGGSGTKAPSHSIPL